MKLIGAMLLLGSALFCGCAAANRLRKHAAYLRLLRQFLTDLTNALRYTLPPVSDLLRSLAVHPAYQQLTFLQTAAEHADAFPESWQEAVRADRQLTADAAPVMESVGQTLGATDLEGQLCALKLCAERLAALQADAEHTAKEKGDLYRSLGLFGGLFCVILLL